MAQSDGHEKFKVYTDKIVQALETPKYRWRTIDGVVRDSGAPKDAVVAFITENKDLVLQSSVPSTSGEPLFTTRKHLLETASTSEKFLGALKNRLY